jgi:hypothetical protein
MPMSTFLRFITFTHNGFTLTIFTMPHDTTQMNIAEPNVLDFAWLRDGSHGQEVSKVIDRVASGGLLHIVNHGLDPGHVRIYM